jgi:hypothetical protein
MTPVKAALFEEGRIDQYGAAPVTNLCGVLGALIDLVRCLEAGRPPSDDMAAITLSVTHDGAQ